MPDLKIQHLLTLLYLLSNGAKVNFITITTSTLAKHIDKSQQAASKHLLDLEKDGFIERIITGRKVSVKITSNGSTELKKILSLLKKNFESIQPTIELNGKLVSGMGEGAYYMALKGYTRQFIKKIGYVPYPGTLNIRLDDKKFSQIISQLEDFSSIKIDSFSDKNRTYGWVKCYDAKLNNLHDCKLIRLERTHHDSNIIEIISKRNLRKTAKLKTGSNIKIKIFTRN